VFAPLNMPAMQALIAMGKLCPALVAAALVAAPGGSHGQSPAGPATGATASATAAAPSAAEGALQATSGDGRFVLLAEREPPCLVVLDAASGERVHAIVPAARDGRVAARIAALRTAPRRRSFVVAPADVSELWEISYDPHAEPIYDGLVHDYRFGEGVPRRGFLGVRRTMLPEPLAAFVLDVHEAEVWGLAAPPPAGSGEGQVINLDVRRRLATRPADEVLARLRSAPAGAASAPRPPEQAAQSRTASRPMPCVAPNVRGP
jgi:hypothetical protein